MGCNKKLVFGCNSMVPNTKNSRSNSLVFLVEIRFRGFSRKKFSGGVDSKMGVSVSTPPVCLFAGLLAR